MSEGSVTIRDSLLNSPTNLKEAIDWILRVTNKDGQQGGSDAADNCWCDLANGVTDLLEGVEHHLDPEEKKIVDNILKVLYNVGGTKHVKALIEKVADQLKVFVGWEGKGGKLVNKKGIGSDGNDRNTKYASHYNGSVKFGFEEEDDDSKVREAKLRCAKILLGVIPFVFSGLSYLYWMSKQGNDNLKVPLRHYVERMGYKWDQWRCKSRQEVDLKEFITVFTTCEVFGKDGVKPGENYATFLDSLRGKAKEKNGLTSGQLPLLKLNIICSGYFRSLHTIDSIRSPAPRLPRTIREILYWLTSLPYCPIYRTLVPKVQEMIRVNGDPKTKSVVFYGSDVDNSAKTLEVSDGNCASYLLGAALVAPMVLLCIQDTIECRVGKVEDAKKKTSEKNYKLENYKDPVAIHDLYANMQFYFSYPLSETQSYYLLQDCLVALFYQMYFLECQTYHNSGGGYSWRYCKYGDQVDCTGCLSWICPVGGKDAHGKGTSGSGNQCGTSNKSSPLQAFLTDCLKGFTCKKVKVEKLKKLRSNSGSTTNNSIYSECYPEFLEHRGHTSVFGQECAVPMGFSGSFKTAAAGPGNGMIGLGIYSVLCYYAISDMSMSGLYQITRCICSLTRRVPRSTGTLFGFFQGIGAMCNGGGGGKVKDALNAELNCCPGWRKPEDLMKAVVDWKGTSHQKDPGKCETLDSLSSCGGVGKKGQTCGYYLRPLMGYLYNSMATQFCETYVSWIIHLTGVLEAGLRKLLEEFRNINCQEAGCKDKKGSTCKCPSNGCKEGTHGVVNSGTGNKEGCCCETIADCAGVNAVLYRFGFSLKFPYALAGNNGDQSKRTCKDFNTQLQNVIEKDLFTKLQTQLRNFIYSTRALFGLYIGVYWSIVLVYLLWSMTVNLDLMHIQSHWRSPRSYLVPLQRILADGSRKGFCTLGYFQEANGDRLLSQGISDVYL